MAKKREHFTKMCEITLMEFENNVGKKFKVTRRIPRFSIAETKVFLSRKEAKEQIEAWLE